MAVTSRRHVLKIVGASITGAVLSPFVVACQQEARETQGGALSYYNGYFFKGGEYIRYDLVGNTIDEGYPKSIASGWPGLWEDGIDAAMLWPDGKSYFFQGSEYVRYDVTSNTADAGYPKSIASGWPGLWESGVDAAALWTDGQAYFFHGGEYILYDVGDRRVNEGYPKPSHRACPACGRAASTPSRCGLRENRIPIVARGRPRRHL